MPFLSQLLGRPTLDAEGVRVGILRDLLISTDIPYPPINAIVVGDKGHLHAIPWLHVASVTPRGTALRSRVRLEAFPAPGDDLIWLGRDLLDKQIVDTHGVKLVRVNDLSLTRHQRRPAARRRRQQRRRPAAAARHRVAGERRRSRPAAPHRLGAGGHRPRRRRDSPQGALPPPASHASRRHRRRSSARCRPARRRTCWKRWTTR